MGHWFWTGSGLSSTSPSVPLHSLPLRAFLFYLPVRHPAGSLPRLTPYLWPPLHSQPSSRPRFAGLVVKRHPPLPRPVNPPQWQKRDRAFSSTLDFLPAPLRQWCSLPCVLCGHGDNSVQHWLFFCPLPAGAGSVLFQRAWKTQFWFPSPSSSLATRAIIGGLWAATRQYVHERSGLPPPSLATRIQLLGAPEDCRMLLVKPVYGQLDAPRRWYLEAVSQKT